MQRIKSKQLKIIFMILFYFFIIWPLYILINHFEANNSIPYHVLKTPLDDLLPFIPQWIFIYASMYAAAITPFILIKDYECFKKMWLSMITVAIIAYLFFIIYPTYDILRPVFSPGNFSEFFLNLDNNHDAPYNCFPSLHAGFSITATIWIFFTKPKKSGIPILIWGFLIAVSILFVKEHYIADFLFGTILAIAVSLFYFKPIKSNINLNECSRKTIWILLPISIYIIEVIYTVVKYSNQVREYLK